MAQINLTKLGKFCVTFNRRSDDTSGLRKMSLGEAQRLLAYAEFRGMLRGRIVPAL